MDYLESMLGGPGSGRFYMQPLIALILAIRDGWMDHRLGEPPFLFALASRPDERGARLGGAMRKVLVPLCMAVGLSLLFQYLIRHEMRLAFALVYAMVFVATPYL